MIRFETLDIWEKAIEMTDVLFGSADALEEFCRMTTGLIKHLRHST